MAKAFEAKGMLDITRRCLTKFVAKDPMVRAIL